MGLAYEGNPRHRDPWQRGAQGSRCPKGVDGRVLLPQSVVDPRNPRRRWATDGVGAYEAKPTNIINSEGDEVWHGFPVPWHDVPPKIVRSWIQENKVTRREVRAS